MNTSSTTITAPQEKCLSVFIFYTDFPAGVHAKQVADGLIRLAGTEVDSAVDIWKLDSIPQVGPLKQAILQEARQADVWILACSSPGDRNALIMQWMNALTAPDSGDKAPTLLIGLFAPPISYTPNFTWFLEMFHLFAERASRDFVWQPINRASLKNVGWLADPAGRLWDGEFRRHSFRNPAVAAVAAPTGCGAN